MPDNIAALAEALIAAHDGGPLVGPVPDNLVPADLEAVYGLQDAIIARTGPVGGWKVAAGSEGEPLCAPIPKARFIENNGTAKRQKHRLFLAELEVAVMLGADLAADADTVAAEHAIGSLHPALELIGNPFTDRDATPRNVQLGDLQSNGLVIVGPAVGDTIHERLGTLETALWHDGSEAKTQRGGADWAAILNAIAWLAGHAARRGLPLKAGQVIITGARPVAPLDEARQVEGRFAGYGQVGVTLT